MKNSPHNLPAIVSVISDKIKMGKLTTAALTASALSIVAISSGCSQPEPVEQNAPKYSLVTADDANEDIGTYVLPQDTSILDEPNADEIFYGKRLLNETKRLLPEHVGAQMNCNSCHISQGKIPMPMGIQTKGLWGHGNVLSDQDAIDVAEFFTHQPRPDFAGKVNDWPNGKKPKDARY
ncbi:hypothetical protein [Psychrobacter sp. M9-54-1]|uniref:hypothetical protein n=1 Tax=Psychrobacter sp. M9-54-1 TaxID=2782386 RepID=UPI001F5B2434|nr:hypothetical protein [Psychrobacter sp. M9-54-1]